jgi:hypothetical protein
MVSAGRLNGLAKNIRRFPVFKSQQASGPESRRTTVSTGGPLPLVQPNGEPALFYGHFENAIAFARLNEGTA